MKLICKHILAGEQAAGLVPTSLFQGSADQIDLESFDPVVEIYAAGDIDIVGPAFRLPKKETVFSDGLYIEYMLYSF